MFHFIQQWKQRRLSQGNQRQTRKAKSQRGRNLPGALIRHSIVIASLLLGTGAFGGTLLGTFAAAPCADGEQAYRIAFGDTLSSIATRFKTSVTNLANHNKIANPNIIFAGQQVCVPLPKINVPPPNSKGEYMTLAKQFASQAGIPPDLFVKQINQESGFNPKALSSAGAIGIAQFMPGTAAGLGINPHDPVQSLRGAASLMARYVKQYGGDYAKALAAYNAGGGALQNAINRGGANWKNFLPGETKNYIRVILG